MSEHIKPDYLKKLHAVLNDIANGHYRIECNRARRKRDVLKSSDIPALRALLASGANRKLVARKFGTTEQNIGLIERGITWRSN